MRLVQVLVVVTFLLVCFASATDSVHTWDWCELAHLPKMIDASTRRSGLVHFAQQFLFPINPTQVGNVTRQLYYVRLYAKEESYLRVAVAPTQHFDVGLYLHKEAEMLERGMNDATLISASKNKEDEEMLTAKLTAHEKYVLTFYSSGFVNWTEIQAMYSPEHNDSPFCPSIHVELQMEPVTSAIKRKQLLNGKCPTSPTFPDLQLHKVEHQTSPLSGYEFASKGQVFFAPYTPGEHKLKVEKAYGFTLPSVAKQWLLLIETTYDFLWSGSMSFFLSRSVHDPMHVTDEHFISKCISEDTCESAVRQHSNTLLMSEIIEPGFNYSLFFYHDYSKTLDSIPDCVPFSFNLTLKPVVLISDNEMDVVTCKMLEPLPQSLNEVGLLSEYTQQTLQFSRSLHASSGSITDHTHFTLVEPSLLRLVIPAHHKVAVIVSLHKKGAGELQHLYTNKTEAEGLFVHLEKGDYFIRFNYTAAFEGFMLPLPYECVSVMMQLHIEPVENVKNDKRVVNTCSPLELPNTFNDNQIFKIATKRDVVQPWSHSISFKVDKKGLLLFSATFDFLTGAVNASSYFVPEASEADYRIPMYPSLYDNTIFLVQEVGEGTFTIELSDTSSKPSYIKCSPFFELDIEFITPNETNVVSETEAEQVRCPPLLTLPDSLYTNDSEVFGGPQDENGTIVFQGADLKVPLSPSHASTFFMIKKPSILRAFLISHGEISLTMGVALLSNMDSLRVAKTFDTVYSSLAMTDLEPSLTKPYALVIAHRFNHSDFEQDHCPPSYTLQMQIMTKEDYKTFFNCVNLPNIVQLPNEFVVTSKDYHYNQDQVFIHGKEINQDMAHRAMLKIQTEGTHYVVAQTIYNFLTADFKLVLTSTKNSSMRYVGNSSIELNAQTETNNNFVHRLEVWNLPAGEYTLDLLDEHQETIHKVQPQECIYLSFELYVEQVRLDNKPKEETDIKIVDQPASSKTSGAPRILSVEPYGQKISKSNDILTITLEFSESVTQPASDKEVLRDEVTARKALYLKDESEGLGVSEGLHNLMPHMLEFKSKSNRTVLQALFIISKDLIHSTGSNKYSLYIAPDFFYNHNKTEFDLPEFMGDHPPVYQIKPKRKVAAKEEEERLKKQQEQQQDELEKAKRKEAHMNELIEKQKAIDAKKKLEKQQKKVQEKKEKEKQTRLTEEKAREAARILSTQSNTKCKPNSCGCIPSPSDPSRCERQLGVCDDSKGSIHCTCIDRYTGPTCSLCAPGYFNYPSCIKAIECPNNCGEYGFCDRSTGKCTCKGNFVGESCSECSSGYAGAYCSTVAPTAYDYMLTFVRVFFIAGGLLLLVCAIIFAICRTRQSHMVGKKNREPVGNNILDFEEGNVGQNGTNDADEEDGEGVFRLPVAETVGIEDDEDLEEEEQKEAKELVVR